MDKTNKIIHKRSSVILENGKAKLPTTDQLEYGELAINFAKGAETISFKNNNDEIVSITTSTALEGVIESNMQNVQASIDAINQTIDENEEVIARALTDLDERIKSTVEVIDGIQKENDSLEDRIDTKLADKVDKTTFETLVGRVDVVQGEDTGKSMRTVAAEEAAKEVAKVVAEADADFDTLKEIADWILNDKTGAAALQNDVAGLKDVVDGYTGKGTIKSAVESIDNRLTDLETGIIENEQVVAGVITDLDERLNNVPNEFAAADTALENKLNAELAKKADTSVVTALAGRVETNEGEITKLKGLEQAYKAADTKIREDFAAADTALKNELNGAIANKADKTTVEAIDNRLTKLEEGVIENEEIIATALTDLDERVISIENVIEENEEITANLFAEMDTRIIELEEKLKDADIDGGEF